MCMELYHGDEHLQEYREARWIPFGIREQDYDKDDEYYAAVESKTDNDPAWV